MKKTHYLKIKDEYIDNHSKIMNKTFEQAKADLIYSVEFVKIGLDEYVKFQDKLIPALEFFEKIEIEKGEK